MDIRQAQPSFLSSMRFIVSLFLMFLVLLSSVQADVSPHSLWNAVGNGNVSRVQILLDQGADPTELLYGRTYLEIAAQNSLYNRVGDVLGLENPWVPVMDLLVQYGADPQQINEGGLTPYEHYMKYVLWYPNPDVAQILRPVNIQNGHARFESSHGLKA